MDALTDDPLANLSAADRLALLRAVMAEDSDFEDDEPAGTTDEGRGSEVPSHQAAIAMMDMARRFVQNEPIVNAAVRGDISRLEGLGRQPRVNVNVRDGLGETALFAAVCHDHLEAAALLLEAGADPNIECSVSWAALHAVSRSGNEAMAALLLKWKANTEVRDSKGWVPLHVSSLYGTNGVATILLDGKADPNARANDNRIPLHTAVDYGHVEVIRNLVRHGAQLDAKDNEGQTPLHIAAMERPFPPPVSLLLDLGANPQLADGNGNTPLHLAVIAGHDPTLAVAPLLRKGIDPNIAAADGWTPLLFAIQQMNKLDDRREAVLKALLEESLTDVNRISSISHGDTTPLILAIETRCKRAVELLLAHNADVNLATERGGQLFRPIVQAAACHSPEEPEILRLLLDAGADPKEKTEDDITLAHITALKGSPNSLHLLLQRGADANAADMLGGTPLHIAARHSHPECVSVLLAHGADVDAMTSDKRTPPHDAARRADE